MHGLWLPSSRSLIPEDCLLHGDLIFARDKTDCLASGCKRKEGNPLTGKASVVGLGIPGCWGGLKLLWGKELEFPAVPG